MSGRQWRRLKERLQDSYRVLTPDFLGSGSMPPWPDSQPFSFELDGHHIASQLEGKFHVVGHSYGGLIALWLARQQPERILSLSVHDAVAFGVLHAVNDAEGLSDLERVATLPIFLDEQEGGGEAWWEAFVDYWNGSGSWRALPDPARAAFLERGRKVYREVRSLSLDRTPAEAYAHIQAPCQLIYGQHSPAAARRVATLIAQALPHGRLLQLSGAGHMGPITHEAAFADYVLQGIRGGL